MVKFGWVILTCIIVLIPDLESRKHDLHLENDSRRSIPISTFGFLKGGFLEVEIHNFNVLNPKDLLGKNVGFTIDRTLNDGLNPYSQNVDRNYCPLKDEIDRGDNVQRLSRIVLTFDLEKERVNIQCKNLDKLSIFHNRTQVPLFLTSALRKKTLVGNPMAHQRRKKRSPADDDTGLDLDGEGDIPPPQVSDLEGNNGKKEIKPDPPAAVLPVDEDKKPSSNDANAVPSLGESNKNGQQQAQNEIPIPKVDEVAAAKQNPSSADGESDVKKAVPPSPAAPVAERLPAENNVPNTNLFDEEEEDKNFRDPASDTMVEANGQGCKNVYLPLTKKLNTTGGLLSTSFAIYINSEEMEGLYMLYFHNCMNEDSSIDLNMSIIEQNQGKNYLSAGEMPLPALYFMMSIIFFISGCFWVFLLKKSKRESGVAVFKIHYLMGALVYLKSLSLLFHAINYHYIQTEGKHVETVAILYYSFHLLKGALLFVTILLIGTGYAFVKHLLSDKDKKIFMIVIPLQILANVAEIIIEESEEGESVHTTWKVIFVSVDLLCCGAILFPVVWSIRHLQEASRTDGKAATNLRKLKLFRHFYIIVVCYIYFTRIIVKLLLRITIPFNYEYVDEMFLEITTFIFFILTGYKFRPAVNNPYLELAHDSDDETDVALTESGLTSGLSKRGGRGKKKTLKEIVLFDPNDEDTDDDEEVLLEKHRDRESNNHHDTFRISNDD